MDRISAKAKQLASRIAVRNVLLIVSFLSIFDVSVVAVGASYLSGNVGAFLGKSGTVILSDFFFLEGTLILTIGIFIAVARAWRETKPSPNEPTDETENTEKAHFSVQMILVGAILIGFSLIVGTLLR